MSLPPARPAWRTEAAAALLAAVLALPQGLAFAALAGVPPAWGLNTAIVCGLVAALAGSSRQVLTGPTNALSLALAASLAPLAAAGSPEYLRLVLVVTLLTGLVQVALALLRLGSLANFIAPSVLLGFLSGAAVLIALQGAKGLLGWTFSMPLARAWEGGAPAVQGAAVAVGALTVALALLLRRLWPRGPTLLLALAGATAISLVVPGQEALARVGMLPGPWPLPAWPEPDLEEIGRLLPIALALTVVGLGQSAAIAKALAQRSGDALDLNRECLGQGLANAVGSFFSCFAACGSLNRSLPYVEAGGRTRRGGVMASLLLLALAALAAPWIALLPMAAIAGVLLLVAAALADRAAWRDLWRLDRREAAVAAGTALSMLVLPLEQAVLAGVAASLLMYLHRTAHPAMRTMGFAGPPPRSAAPAAARPFVVLSPQEPAAPECPQLKLLRMEGSVWFGAAAHVADQLRVLRAGADPPRHLLVMAKSMNFIDAAGAALWEHERRERAALGGGLYFHRPRPEVLDAWRRSGFAGRLGEGHVFADKRSAIAAIVPRLDPQVCARCRARVFEECAGRPGPPAP
jgi:SulP family sulfate permease